MKKKKKAVKKTIIKKVFHKVRRELFLIFVAVITLLIFIPIFTYAYFARDLSSTTAVMNRNSTGVVLYDRNGKEFFKFYEAKYKKYIPLSSVPERVRQSIIVAEDKDFYTHPGFSIKAILGALIADIKNKDFAYGGSTITQQLVKNALLTSQKDFLRKYQEIVLAQELERRYSKDQILEMYLNSVYFGEGAFGIEAASQTYFGKSTKDLSVSESSMIAGLLTAPSVLSPISGSKELALKRQHYVLGELLDKGVISKDEYKKAMNTKVTYASVRKGFPYKAPHFALMVKDQLIKEYGEEQIARSGFKIYTTLDLDWQEYAEKAVDMQVQNLKGSNVSNGAAVVVDPRNGEVRVLVGSHDWFDNTNGKVNMATTPRQPGSSFKPIIYADALEQRVITPATVLKDEPTTFQTNYKPEDYDKKFRGPVLARRALANSLNIPSVEVMQRLGLDEGLGFAKKMGITTLKDPSQYGLSLVLGSGEVPLIEMTNAYATFANSGKLNKITLIHRIEDKRGKTIFVNKQASIRVLGEDVAFLISSILSDNTARREVFGSALDTPGIVAAVKTGTSEDYRDSLTLGYTKNIAVGVWVGNNNNQAMTKVAGSLGAAPIWKSLITKFTNTSTPEKFSPPDGVVQLSICKSNGLLAKVSTSSATAEYFLTGTEPNAACSFNGPTLRRSTVSIPNKEQNKVFIEAQRQEIENIKRENTENTQKLINEIKKEIKDSKIK